MEILGEDEEKKASDEDADEDGEAGNFFALRELMKLEYQMLTKTERCFRELAVFWSNKTEIMKQVMDLMLYEDNGLQYEAILQLSLFILLPNRSEAILNLLVKNAQAIVDIIRPFEPHSHDENFRVL